MIKRHYSEVIPEEVTMYGSTNTTIQWLVTKEDGAPRFALRRFVVKSEGVIPLHDHLIEHEIFILSGCGTVFTENETYEVSSGDVLFIPPEEPHGYKCEGNEPLVFLCIIPYL
jgi:quercetin dioxygenase-like cupin family protein